MIGSGSSDSCYQTNMEGTCYSAKMNEDSFYQTNREGTRYSTKMNEGELCYQQLGHSNVKNIQKLININVVKGLPMLKLDNINICGDCQIGKQVKIAHPMLSKCCTHSKVF